MGGRIEVPIGLSDVEVVGTKLVDSIEAEVVAASGPSRFWELLETLWASHFATP